MRRYGKSIIDGSYSLPASPLPTQQFWTMALSLRFLGAKEVLRFRNERPWKRVTSTYLSKVRHGATHSSTANGLLAAAQAQAFWKQAIQDQQFAREFASHCERTRLFYKPDFDLAASLMLMELSGRCSSFLFDLEGELGEEFGIMVSMGFFERCGRIWHMVIPQIGELNTFKELILRFTRTADCESVLRLDDRVTCMSSAESSTTAEAD